MSTRLKTTTLALGICLTYIHKKKIHCIKMCTKNCNTAPQRFNSEHEKVIQIQ